jgi:hypothetical protein
MTRLKSRIAWLAFFVAAVALLPIGRWAYLEKYKNDREHACSVARECLGQTKAEILSRFGPPTNSWVGIYAPLNPSAKGPVETITYARQFGTAAGTLCILLEKRGDQAFCIAADWLPEGAEF